MGNLSRRSFLKSVAVSGGVAGLYLLGGRSVRAAEPIPGFSDLVPTPSENTGEMLLALPQGFRYTVFGQRGSIMNDGRPTPTTHDGMAASCATTR